MTWPNVRFGDMVELVRRPISIDPDGMYPEVGIRSFGRGTFHKPAVLGSEISRDLFQVCAGDLLVNLTFAWEGAVAIATEADDGRYASHRFYSFCLKNDAMFLPFLSTYFATPAGLRRLQAISPGGAGRNRVLSLRKLLEELVPLPPISEQRGIVARLNAATAAIERVQALRAKIDEDLAALVIRSNNTFDAQPTCLGDALFLDEDRVAVNSDAIYTQAGIRGFGGGLFRKGGVTAADTTYRHFNRLAAGQFVVSQVKGWEGAVAVCSDEFAGLFVSPEYRTFRCNPAVLRPAYLAYLSRTPWFHAQLAPATRGQGARRERLRPEMLLAIRILLPPVEVQESLIPLFERIAAAAEHSGAADLDQLLPAMLDEIFNTGAGERRKGRSCGEAEP